MLDANARTARTMPSFSDWLPALLFSTPLLCDVLRRYVLASDLFLIVPDIIMLLALGVFVINGKPICMPPNIVTVCAFSLGCFMALAAVFNSNSLILTLLAYRAQFVPLLYAIVAASCSSSNPQRLKRLYIASTIWVVVIGGVALAQLFFGQGHWISTGTGDSVISYGDFSAHGSSVRGLFRPNSIFLSTGKMGMTLFTIILFRWVYLVCNSALNVRAIPYIVVDIVSLAVSGQRAAVTLMVVVSALLVIYSYKQRRVSLLKGALISGACIAIIALCFLILLPENVKTVVAERYLISIQDASDRFGNNIIGLWNELDQRTLLIGNGLGLYTIGTQRYGGIPFYLFANNGENSWLRLVAEGGVGYALLVFLLVSSAALSGVANIKRTRSSLRTCSMFVALWFGCIFLWSGTHDWFANSATMSIGFFLAGGYFQRTKAVKHANLQSGVSHSGTGQVLGPTALRFRSTSASNELRRSGAHRV